MAVVKIKAKILLFDRDLDFRRHVARLIEEKGRYDVVEAGGLVEALRLLEEHRDIHLMITELDEDAPRREMMYRIRRINPCLEVIILSGRSDPHTILSFFEQGYARYLMKPISAEELHRAIGEVIIPEVDYFRLCGFLNVFSRFSSPVYFVNANREIIYGNRAFLQLFNLKSRDVDRHPACCTTLHYDYCEKSCVCGQPFETGKIFKVRELLAKLPEKTLNLFASFMPVYDRGTVKGLLVNVTDYSSQAEIQDRFHLLYEKEREKTVALENARAELENLNRRLEELVDARTAELKESRGQIKQVLDHIDRAILTFDESGWLSEGCSAASCEIFGVDDPKGMTIFQILGLPLGGEGHRRLGDWITLCFKAYGEMSWEEMEPLSPLSEWEFRGRILQTRWNPVEVDGRLMRLMMINKDVTKEMQLARQIQEERRKMEREMLTLSRFIGSSEDELIPYLKELQEKLGTLRSLVEEGAAGLRGNTDDAFRSAHTIKGGAALMGFEEIENFAHRFEDCLDKARRPGGPAETWIMGELRAKYMKLASAGGKLFDWARRLGLYEGGAGEKRRVRVECDRIAGLVRLLREDFSAAIGPDAKERLESEIAYLAEVSTVSCGRYFHRFAVMMEKLSGSRGKDVNPLRIRGGELRLDPGFAEKILPPLTQLLRNAVAHGVEPPEERLHTGKAARATISLGFMIGDGFLYAEVEDDGRGIDREKLHQKCREKGLVGDAPLSPEEKLRLIFRGGVSTADSVSKLSGRGVGMGIALSVIEAMGGRIDVKSEPGKGTLFTIKVPLPG